MKEYRIVEVKLSEAEAKMNEMVRLGWEVAGTDLYLGGGALAKSSVPMLITFVREIERL